MSIRFKTPDREQPYLLPPDLKEWIPEDDIVHFVIEAAERVSLGVFTINERGTGSEQYHPHMMLALLLYCYCHGIFSSRRIERATWKDVSVRFICGNTHPDHDTICDFRVRNERAIAEAFLHILKLAREMGILKIGTVSIDGTKIKANASIYKSVRYDRAKQLEQELSLKIDELLQKAKEADSSGNKEEGDRLNGELKRLSILREKMTQAQKKLEERAKDKSLEEMEQFKKKSEKYKKRNGRGRPPKAPPPQDVSQKSQQNLTDGDSRIMKKSRTSEYVQAYNAQAVVDAGGTMLVLGARVTNNGNDMNELSDSLNAIPAELGKVETVLADKGYASEVPVREVQESGVTVLVSVNAESSLDKRRFDFRPQDKTAPARVRRYQKAWISEMSEMMKKETSRELYKLRKQTVEPVFGIVKSALGFRSFSLRSLEKANLEWMLVMCAWNLKRLAKLAQ